MAISADGPVALAKPTSNRGTDPTASITLQGDLISTIGELPSVGSNAADDSLTNGDLAEVDLAAFLGKRKILGLVPFAR